MSRSNVPPQVAKLAQKQTGPDLASSHPLSFGEYCRELKKHLSCYPHDDNFKAEIKPRTHLGIVSCLEARCANERIPLERNNAPDSGLSAGVGSLSSYRMHIIQSQAHRESRLMRLEVGKPGSQLKTTSLKGPAASPSTPVARRSALFDTPNSKAGNGPSHAGPSRLTSAARSRQLLARSSGASRLSSIKAEPAEAVIPRKRAFDIPIRLKKEESIDPVGATISIPPAKRVKSEAYVTPKTPLRPVNREPSFGDSTSSRADMFDERFVEMRLILSDVDQEMKRVQEALSEVEDKPYKTQDDVTRIVNLESELWRLIELKEDCSATIHSVPGATRFGTSEYMSAPAYSMQHQSVPSGSNVHLPPAFQDPDFAQQRNVLVNNGLPQVNAPVASGSGVKLEEHTGYAKVETDALDLDFRRVTADMPGMIQPLSDDERFDEDGNFYGRGRDTFHGPVAKADDIDKFLVSAGNAELFDGNASVEKALNKLRLPVLYTPLPGMEIALMPHQVIGVAWMLEKERGSEKGGCLADEMGLGKTVQMIATIAMNLSPDPLRKTTLIVAPLALLDQWKLEIETKTNLNLQCLIYHGTNKPRSLDQLRKYDVVLTTFQTLANEWPDEEAMEKAKKKRKKRKTQNGFIVDDDSEEEKALKKNKKTKGPLFIMEWYRIVLDEAQNIRNRRTRVSRAVSKLQSTYRWCLTGTPIINGLADAYGLLRFLQYRPWYDWENFNGHISRIEKRNPMLATSRLQAIFKAILFRRKKDTMLDGKRLIELPSKEVVLHKLEFSPEERAVYNMVEAKSQAIFNRFLRAGTVLKNYHQVLVLLLRLRQVCSHPSLIQEEGVAYVDPGQEDISQKTVELARAERLLGLEFVQRMQAKFRQITLERIAAEKASAEATLEGDDIECPVCFDNYADPIITACGHSFCRECINNVLNAGPREEAAEPTHYKADERPCPACRGAISHDMIFSRVSFEPSDEELRGAMAGPVDVGGDVKILDAEAPELKPARAVRKRKGPSRRVLDSDEEETDGDDDGLSDFIVKDDEDENEKDARWRLKGKRKENIVLSDDEDDDLIIGAKPDVPAASDQIKLMPKFLPSTKMKHMMESLKEWAETHPSEKTLIVSQWTGCLELVSNYLTENQFAHVKYQGNMRRGERDRVVRAFMSKDKAAVMLMSLKCGGVGLNLTRANRVINLDLGWSLAIEQQAYDRVHRLGQHRDVFVHRLVIANTVEDRILIVQERKKGLAESSLGEGGGRKLGRLSVKELANLFGLDHRGRVLEPQGV